MGYDTSDPPTSDKPFWQSKKVFMTTLSMASWTAIIWLMITEKVGVGAGVSIPKELWWCTIFKAFVEVLAIGGQGALDYFLRLPFAQAIAGSPAPEGKKKSADVDSYDEVEVTVEDEV